MSYSAKEFTRVKTFIETYCICPETRKQLVLMQWQEDWLKQLFGMGDYENGVWKRQYNRTSLWIPRGNGKSSLLATICLYLACEMYNCPTIIIASTTKQAEAIYRQASFMAEGHPELKQVFWVRDHRKLIVNTKTKSEISIKSLSPSGSSGGVGNVFLDEISEHNQTYGAQTWDRVFNNVSKRKNSIWATLSTANHNRETLAYKHYIWSKNVIEKPELAPNFLPKIFEANPDKWEQPDEWKKCNPAMGSIIDPKEFQEDYNYAKANPRELNRFKIFRLNLWAGSAERFIQQDVWDNCYQAFDEKDFHYKNGNTYASMDLSRKGDLTSYCICGEKDGKLHLMVRSYIPEEIAKHKIRQDKVPYDLWREQGWITYTTGDRIDFKFIIQEIVKDYKDFQFREMRYDPNYAELIRQELQYTHGIEMVEMGQTATHMASPTGELERLAIAGKIVHNNNPVLNWAMDNVIMRKVQGDLWLCDKARSSQRIDPVIASIMALSGWMANQEPEYGKASDYLGNL